MSSCSRSFLYNAITTVCLSGVQRIQKIHKLNRQYKNDMILVRMLMFPLNLCVGSSHCCRAVCSPLECAIFLPRFGLQATIEPEGRSCSKPVEKSPAVFAFRGDTQQLVASVCRIGCLFSP